MQCHSVPLQVAAVDSKRKAVDDRLGRDVEHVEDCQPALHRSLGNECDVLGSILVTVLPLPTARRVGAVKQPPWQKPFCHTNEETQVRRAGRVLLENESC